MILTALSGPQGCGKTTLLEGIKRAMGRQLESTNDKALLAIDDFKVARTVLAQNYPGMSLDEVVSNPKRAAEFQTEILFCKSQRDMHLKNSHLYARRRVHLTERSLADVRVYAEEWFAANPFEHSNKSVYYRACDALQQQVYDFVIFVPYGTHEFVEEHNRASKEAVFRVESRLVEVLEQVGTPTFVVEPFDVEGRVEAVIGFIAKLATLASARGPEAFVRARDALTRLHTSDLRGRFESVVSRREEIQKCQKSQ